MLIEQITIPHEMDAPPSHINVTSCYIHSLFDADRLTKHVGQIDVECDTLVGTGFSGTLPLHTIARKCNIPNILAIRRPGETTHGAGSAEGRLGRKWLFVDDFFETGSTFMRVYLAVQEIASNHGFTTELVGAFTYDNYEKFSRPGELSRLVSPYYRDYFLNWWSQQKVLLP